MSVEVVVPFGGTCPHRQRAWEWVRGRYPWPPTLAPHSQEPWSKARAVMPAIERSAADVIVVADADVWTDGLQSAVRAITCGVAAWAVPHRRVHRLSEAGTDALLRGGDWEGQWDRPPYPGIRGGGIVVAERRTLLDIPLDRRFTGFGQEDECWAMALHCLAGPCWRGDADLLHLWHPPQPRMTLRRGSPESWKLRRRYAAVRANPDGMRSLIDEARDVADPTPESPVHPDPALALG